MSDDEWLTFGGWVRRFRTRRDMSVEAMADYLTRALGYQFPEERVRAWESEELLPALEDVRDLARKIDRSTFETSSEMVEALLRSMLCAARLDGYGVTVVWAGRVEPSTGGQERQGRIAVRLLERATRQVLAFVERLRARGGGGLVR